MRNENKASVDFTKKMINRVAAQTYCVPGRQYLFGLAVVLLFSMIDIAWLYMSGCSVREDGILLIAKTLSFLLSSAVGLAAIAAVPRYRQVTKRLRYEEIARTLAWMALLLCFVPVAGVLSYLSVTVNASLVDESLVRFDRALGFDWPSVYYWVHSHAVIQQILAFAYDSGRWQLIGVPVVLGVLGRREELSGFVLLLMLSSALLLLISTPFPAASAFLHFNITDPNTSATVSDFDLLRNGKIVKFDLLRIQGLVSFPSFHTALAVFFAYSLRRTIFLFPFAVLLNATMVISTPTQGGHYLVDVFGGLTLALVTIYILKLALTARVLSHTPFKANANADATAG
ncbi:MULTISPECIES: phosphatase PAP2 family protein [Paraburkholderia]|uniref:phosphatase PAP2 family protein n=1 Tax=Paraburkholderia TaxID=1822464 RepID=UPI0016561C28|nr:phosphatase PAP2 family protein [Paraburkholderia podalyriae]